MGGGCSKVMGYQTPEGDVVCYFLGAEEDSLAGKSEPNEGCREGADGCNAIEVIYGDAVFRD